jgi:hypothetical protein
MRILRNAGVWAACLTIVPALFAATEERFDRRFKVGSGAQVIVEVDFGGIEVVTNAASEVVIDVFRKVKGPSAAKEKEFLEERPVVFAEDEGKVTVKAGKAGRPGANWSWNKTKVEGLYKISVPSDCRVRLETAGGHVHVTGIQAAVDAKTAGGALRFQGIRGPINGDTSGGGVAVIQCDGEIDVETSGGGIEVKGGAGTLNADTSGGSIRVTRFAGPAQVETSGGSITVEEVAGKIVGNTSGGSITAVLSGPTLPGTVDLETAGGSVNLTVPEGVAFSLDAATSSGGVRSDIPVEFEGKPRRNVLNGVVNGGGPRVKLRTSGGTISVKKGMAAVR